MTAQPGVLPALERRLSAAHRTLTQSATFDQVLEELSGAREELAAFQIGEGLDRRQAIALLENAHRQLRYISLAARNLMDLRTGLASCGPNVISERPYLPGRNGVAGSAGRHLNVEA